MIGRKAVENVVVHHDYHATLFHIFGLDPQPVAFPRATDTSQLIERQQARVVRDILI